MEMKCGFSGGIIKGQTQYIVGTQPDCCMQDKELMEFAEKLARNPTIPIDHEIQKLLENKYDDRY